MFKLRPADWLIEGPRGAAATVITSLALRGLKNGTFSRLFFVLQQECTGPNETTLTAFRDREKRNNTTRREKQRVNVVVFNKWH